VAENAKITNIEQVLAGATLQSDLHCTTARERYDLLMQRCPGIVGLLDLQDIASFLNVHPNTISKIRRDITFEGRK
jgi:hypothetical protein